MPTCVCDCCSTVREGGEGRAEMVVRVQAQDQSWVWLYMVLQLQPGEIPISSNNYIIRYLLTNLLHPTPPASRETEVLNEANTQC